MTDAGWTLSMPAATTRWTLVGPAGPGLDVIVASLTGAGVLVEVVAPGTAYRLHASDHFLRGLSDAVEKIPGFRVAIEEAPTESITLSTTAPPSPIPRRTITVHGAGAQAAHFIRVAVDYGLTVQTVGVQRWAIAGPSATLISWAAAAWSRGEADVLNAFGLTAEQVRAEDAPAPAVVPTVNIILPDRKITSEITRDRAGDISTVVQTETSV